MDRRYDQTSRDRYMSRPRFEERREERYYRRDDGLNRPWPHSRYPSPPPPSSSRRQHYDGPPRRYHDCRHSPRKEADRVSSLRWTEEKKLNVASQDLKAKKEDIPESRSKEMPAKEAITKKESAVAQDESTIAVAMTQDESVKVDTQSEQVTSTKMTKARVYKEAVVSFDSDGEDQLMQADWGYDSDEESVVVDLQHNTASKIEEKVQAEEPLPASWVVHLSDKGEKYYYNKVTRETVWDKPTADTMTTNTTSQQEKDDKQVTVKNTPRQDVNNSKNQNNSSSSSSNTKNGSNSNGDSNRKDKNSTSDSDRTKKENDIGRHNSSSNNIGSKRKHSPSAREETRLPPSLASRISYPKSTSEVVLHHQPSRRSERDRHLPPPQPRVHHLNHHRHSHEYRSNSRYSPPPPPPLPPSDRYYRSNAPPLPPHSNGREVWIDHHHHHHSPYRHHPMDYAPLPPPPSPPRWISGRRIDYDRREPPPYVRRSSRDYR